MVVTVRLHTTLRRETPEGIVDRLTLDLAPGATMRTLVEALGISLRDDAILLVVNGRIADVDTALAEGDEVRLIPAMSGGGSRP
jgi:molybdopterin converting factor small subunit